MTHYTSPAFSSYEIIARGEDERPSEYAERVARLATIRGVGLWTSVGDGLCRCCAEFSGCADLAFAENPGDVVCDNCGKES